MTRKKKETQEEVKVEEPASTPGPAKEEPKKESLYEAIFKMGKKPQTRSLLTNPKSKYYNHTIAKRRAKEKNRRKANQLKRRK